MPSSIRTVGQLGPILKALRERKGLSQTDLGKLLGLSQERISAIESHPERVTLNQLLTLLMTLDAELSVGARKPADKRTGAGEW